MLVIALCLLGLIASAGVVIDSIGTRKKLRYCIYSGIHVLVFMACAYKMTGVAEILSEQKTAIRENARSARILERSIVRLAQAEGADAVGSSNELVLSALGKASERQLREMAAYDADPAGRKPDRQRVLKRLADVYAGEVGDLPRVDEGAAALPSIDWMNQKLQEYGFSWRVKAVSVRRAETVDIGPDGVEEAMRSGNVQSVDLGQ